MRDLDERGVPGCFVITTEFEPAARSQCSTLGFEPAIVWTPHPIQNRTEAELEQLADDTLDAVLAAITKAPETEASG